MNVGAGAAGVDSRMDGILQSVGGAIHVLVRRTTERGNLDVPALGRNGTNRGEVTFRGDRKACFDDVDSEILKLFGHLDLLCQIHRAAGRLFAVAQGCIKDADSVLWHGVPLLWASKSGCYGGMGQ